MTFTYRRGAAPGTTRVYYRSLADKEGTPPRLLCTLRRLFPKGYGWVIPGHAPEVQPFMSRWVAAFEYLAVINTPVSEALEQETELAWRRVRAHMPRVSTLRMTPEAASAVWDVLVAECGARDTEDFRERITFVALQIPREHPCAEYRFGGGLGFGGKFYVTDRWYVSCYTEDYDPETRLMIAKVNAALVWVFTTHFVGTVP